MQLHNLKPAEGSVKKEKRIAEPEQKQLKLNEPLSMRWESDISDFPRHFADRTRRLPEGKPRAEQITFNLNYNAITLNYDQLELRSVTYFAA